VSFVVMALSLSSDRKRLTWTGAGPDGTVVWPSGKSEGVGPAADPGEEVALGVSGNVSSGNIDN
jgi:hypothetical protein